MAHLHSLGSAVVFCSLSQGKLMAHHLSDIYSNITVKLFTSNPTDAALHHTASVLKAS